MNNLDLYEFNKKFGKYEICGMGDYNHCFILNRGMLIKQENVPLAFSTCVNFDSNASSYISCMSFKNRQDNDGEQGDSYLWISEIKASYEKAVKELENEIFYV